MSFAFAAVIRMTIVLVCAGIATLMLKRSSASVRYAVWTVALLCGLLLPRADALIPAATRMNLPVLPAIESEAVIVRSFIPDTTPVATPLIVMASHEASTSRPLSQWLTIVWAFGCIVLIGPLIAASLSVRSVVRHSPPISGLEWKPLMEELRGELSIAQSVELRDGGSAPPFTFGLFRHAILLPSNSDSWTPNQKRAVLAHELAHARRYDGLIQLLVQIVCSIYWFHPIVWLAARRMRLERERACDDIALRVGVESSAYANHLLTLASGGNWNATLASVSIAHPSQLETRLRAILNPKASRGRVSRWAAVFLISSLAILLFSIAAVHLTSILSLSLPTSFHALAAPRIPRPEPVQQPIVTPIVTGSVAGRVVWVDGAASTGAIVSAIETSTAGLPSTWVMGTRVARSAITDSNGQYRIEDLPPGLYHIVTGPVYLPRTFSDVSLSSSTHLVNVTAGRTAMDMDFTCVRNAEGASFPSTTMLTITGKIIMKSFGGPSGPAVLLNNADGSESYWQFRESTQNARYWWPGLDPAKGGVLQKMYQDGEVITVSGVDTGSSRTGRWPTLHVLIAREVTRGGVPSR